MEERRLDARHRPCTGLDVWDAVPNDLPCQGGSERLRILYLWEGVLTQVVVFIIMAEGSERCTGCVRKDARNCPEPIERLPVVGLRGNWKDLLTTGSSEGCVVRKGRAGC